jgi:meso-butanediol dehydrogenase / (S,S)-butanediol dehydrogenase / diacetyl reductase
MSDEHLHGPAIVSGGASGIGQAIAIDLASRGCAVTIVDRQRADATLEGIRRRGGEAGAVSCDVSDSAATDNAAAAARAQYGTCRILVNAAGVSPAARVSFLDETDEEWARTMAINAGGVFNLTRSVTRMLVDEGAPGRVVNILSTASFMGFAGMAAYCASKGAVLALTQTLALELAQYEVTVNGVAPGSVSTAMSKAFRAESPPQQAAAIAEHDRGRTPLGGPGRPSDVAAAVRFLAGESASWITGTVITVDGGFMANGTPWFDADGRLAMPPAAG